MKEFISNFIDVKINLYTNDGYLSRFQRESLAIVNVGAKPVTSFNYFRYQQYLSRIDDSSFLRILSIIENS